ncbi:hypothetical protein FRX31_016991 [Thalictrum thalictroides]|uniref:Transmembrane protein n=1 Tax=Thalictrum thalictroides TaxID=46969 RepID=A0A7J6WB67_THATH|nr:hypothetical protein FRX31_016991 [Thalictrum thalictroides]
MSRVPSMVMAAIVVVLVIVLISSIHPLNATRVLYEEEERLVRRSLISESLQRGPVPPSGPSGCTYIPGSGGPSCPIQGKKVAAANAFSRDRVDTTLQRGPVPPSGPSGCTYIPGNGGPSCPPINGKKVAGSAFARARAYARLIVPFTVTTLHDHI